jgi:rhodanese-related sulfurtransferase
MKIICKFTSVIALLAIFIGSNAFALSSAEQKQFNEKAAASVKKIVKKNKLEVVNYDYVLKAVDRGTRKAAKAIIVDARPLKKYQASHIPSALALPEAKAESMYGAVLSKVSKDKDIIVYCGGFKCAKSAKLAVNLLKKGHKNVKVYVAGMPDWASKNYVEIETNVAKAIFTKNDTLFIDARPWPKFYGSTIIGSLNIPDTKFDKYAGFLPIDKATPVITYCGGYACDKSHIVANKLVGLGYKNVKVYAAGFPVWKKAGNPVTGGGNKVMVKKDTKPQMSKGGNLMLGLDTGTVDGEWFVKNYKKLPKSVTLVDVRPSSDYKTGTIPGAINIFTGDKKAKEFVEAIPEDGEVVIFCGTGTRAIEGRSYIEEIGKGLDRVLYIDANIKCNKSNECKIDPNEPLGI